MAQERLINAKKQTVLQNRKLLKARFKNLLSTIDDDINAVTNVATAKAALTKTVRMVKVLSRFIYEEADGE